MLAAPRVPRLTDLKLGDVVVHLDQTYVVNQRIVHHANGFFWFDYQLYGGEESGPLWLSVEDDDELVAVFYQPVDMALSADPGTTLTVEGEQYRLKESGESDAKIERESGSETRTLSKEWDYVGAGGSIVSVSRWGEDEYEVMRGTRVNPAVLELMPGS